MRNMLRPEAQSILMTVPYASGILSVPVAVLLNVERGDRFVLGPEILIVQSAGRDATGTAWRVACLREE